MICNPVSRAQLFRSHEAVSRFQWASWQRRRRFGHCWGIMGLTCRPSRRSCPSEYCRLVSWATSTPSSVRIDGYFIPLRFSSAWLTHGCKHHILFAQEVLRRWIWPDGRTDTSAFLELPSSMRFEIVPTPSRLRYSLGVLFWNCLLLFIICLFIRLLTSLLFTFVTGCKRLFITIIITRFVSLLKSGNTTRHTHGQFSIPSSPRVHVFGLLEEGGEPGVQLEIMRNPVFHLGIEPRTSFACWGPAAIY